MLSSDFVNENFRFFEATLRGTKQIKPRWKRVVAKTDEELGEALGKLYVAEHFPPEAKARALEMVNNLKEALADRIKTLEWMDEPTKQEALKKLAAFTVKIGYPDKWRDYSPLKIDRGLVCAQCRARRCCSKYERQMENRQAGRSHRMGHDAADGERLLQPEHERDRVPGRHPAAAVLRSEGRRRRELRRHRRGDRPRNDARLRRPGPAVRRGRATCATGGRRNRRRRTPSARKRSWRNIPATSRCRDCTSTAS